LDNKQPHNERAGFIQSHHVTKAQLRLKPSD